MVGMGKLKLLTLLFFLLIITPFAFAKSHNVDMYVFHGQGCPHCASLITFLDENIRPNYPTLNITLYEVYGNADDRQFFQDMAAAFGTTARGVPTIFINGKVISGFSNSIAVSIEQEIERCVDEGCESPGMKLQNGAQNDTVTIGGDSSPAIDPKLKRLTIPAVIAAAAVDSINPCEFAVLIILLTSILAAGIKKRALYAGLAFSASIYIMYFLMGLGLFSALQAAGLTHLFYTITAILAIALGIFNLKDYLWYGKWFVMEVPLSWRPRMKAVLRGITSVPGAFLIGFVVSLFLLPCTSGPYIVILGLLAETSTRAHALPLLLLYNLIFILPMLIITFAIYFGITTTEQAEQWKERKLKVLHLITGVIILLLGIGMLIAMKLGIV